MDAFGAGFGGDGLETLGADIDGGMTRMERDFRAAELRRQRRARDAGHARRQHGACSAGACGPWSMWWLVFPLVFVVLPALKRLEPGGMVSEFGAWAFAPLVPLADLLARLIGVSPSEAGAPLILAVIVNGAALAFALTRNRSPRRG